jgi:hypothetical protein
MKKKKRRKYCSHLIKGAKAKKETKKKEKKKVFCRSSRKTIKKIERR